MFALKIFWGSPTRFVVCANEPWPMSAVCKNFGVQHPLGAAILYSEKSPLGWINMSVYKFLVSGPKFTKFFGSIGDEMWLIKYFSDFRYVDPFRRYSRSKPKVVKNRAEFWTFFALPNFVGGTPCKISVNLIT